MMFTALGRRCTLFLASLAVTLLVAGILSADDKPEESAADLRPYAEGPLSTEDYRAETPDPLPRSGGASMLAYTWTHIRFTYEYKYQRQGANYLVTLSAFEPMAYIDRQVSWNASQRNQKLLDHEQGHFDITYLAALRLRKEVEQLRREGRTLQASGQTLPEAVKDLERQLTALVEKYDKAAGEEHLRYDQMTSHGAVRSVQARYRSEQQKQIEEFAKEFKLEADLLFGN